MYKYIFYIFKHRSLNSGEAEARTITKGCVECIHAKNLLEGLTGETHNLEVWTDSSSARAISQRLGPGRRAKQFGVWTMWVQQVSTQCILTVNTRRTCCQHMDHKQFLTSRRKARDCSQLRERILDIQERERDGVQGNVRMNTKIAVGKRTYGRQDNSFNQGYLKAGEILLIHLNLHDNIMMT